MNHLIDIAGQRFGRLIAVRHLRLRGKTVWLVICDCGNEHYASGSDLRAGKVRSCGCLNQEMRLARNHRHGHAPRHRQARHPMYEAWCAMVQRCRSPRSDSYRWYGARGITICDRWADSFQAFLDDVGERPDGMMLDRIDNDKGYEPGNVRWATPSQQASNRRSKWR